VLLWLLLEHLHNMWITIHCERPGIFKPYSNHRMARIETLSMAETENLSMFRVVYKSAVL
jgi:hypothetical protein